MVLNISDLDKESDFIDSITPVLSIAEYNGHTESKSMEYDRFFK